MKMGPKPDPAPPGYLLDYVRHRFTHRRDYPWVGQECAHTIDPLFRDDNMGSFGLSIGAPPNQAIRATNMKNKINSILNKTGLDGVTIGSLQNTFVMFGIEKGATHEELQTLTFTRTARLMKEVVSQLLSAKSQHTAHAHPSEAVQYRL